MSVTRQHNEWLSLVEVSGPFLSLPVLARVFPQGVPPHDPDHARRLRAAHAEWRESQQKGRTDAVAIHQQWVRFVLTETLGIAPDALVGPGAFPAQAYAHAMPEYGEVLRPDFAVWRKERDEPARLLVTVMPDGQDLDVPLPGKGWKASPATRMAELLRNVGVPLGLVTNGEQWMLVHAPPKEATGFASWYAQIWQDEPDTLRAFRALLGMERFFAVPDAEMLPALYRESAENQQEVTDRLGEQVREAVAMLVRTLDRLDRDHGRTLLAAVPPETLYEASLAVMMRIVFLLFAEENGLLPRDNPVYGANYAISTLGAQLRAAADQGTEEVLEHRTDAWNRLLAVFRVVHGGATHSEMRIIAYGGEIFDPDRYPFLEGRVADTSWRDTPANPLPIDNRTVLHLLEALQFLRMAAPGGGMERRRLSFRALDIEQIGHVYEGLLDHTARRAAEPVVSLRGAKERGTERVADLPLATLEAERATDEDTLLKLLKEQTGRSLTAVKGDLAATQDAWARSRLMAAVDNDEELFARVLPFVGLARRDDRDRPLVVPTGSIYLTTGTDRRSTGTHYTPRSLTEPIVRHTLDPLVFDGPAQGWPQEQWKRKGAEEILALTVCDMAMGSGAFLVQACRYLAERLVEAWQDAEDAAGDGAVLVLPEGTPAKGLIGEQPLPRDARARFDEAKRLIADRCLYGVDVNRLAVEMAKLSLWLVTAQKDRPFTFLDHALRCGDSLLGIAHTEQLALWSLRREEAKQERLAFYPAISRAIADAITARRLIEETPTRDVRDYDAKEELLGEALTATRLVRLGADLLIGAALHPVKAWREETSTDLLHRYMVMMNSMADVQAGKFTVEGAKPTYEEAVALRGAADNLLAGRRPFHWPLEFPEVFVGRLDGTPPGFAAIVGNPPFMGGQKITGALGTPYRDYLVDVLAEGKRGSADLCAYFFLRAMENVRPNGGSAGLLATNTIAQGTTREVGLDQLLDDNVAITRAVQSEPWPGDAALEIAHVWLRRGAWEGPQVLDGKPAKGITAYLNEQGEVLGQPELLITNTGKSFQGVIVLGMGFTLTPDEATALIARHKSNRDVIFPYLIGEDLNGSPSQSAGRWIINFQDWPLERAESYPDCMAIVRERVKGERDTNADAGARRFWWRFLRPRPDMHQAINGLKKVLAIALTSKTLSPAFVDADQVLDQSVIVIASEESALFAVMASSLHYWWSILYGTPMKRDARYNINTCFEKFPFPVFEKTLATTGERYNAFRADAMLSRQQGLTSLYNCFHNRDELAGDIQRLRELHREMDEAVVEAYGWTDIDLNHGFHETKHGVRYTISEAARREVLDRLLRLNHERYAAEVAAGLHTAGGKKTAKKARSAKQGQIALAGVDP